MTETCNEVVRELRIALEKIGAPEDLKAILGAWRSTRSDKDLLQMLRDFNKREAVWEEIHPEQKLTNKKKRAARE